MKRRLLPALTVLSFLMLNGCGIVTYNVLPPENTVVSQTAESSEEAAEVSDPEAPVQPETEPAKPETELAKPETEPVIYEHAAEVSGDDCSVLYNTLLRGERKVFFQETKYEEDIKDLVRWLNDAHPEVFWINGGFYMQQSGTGTMVDFALIDGIEESEISSMQTELESAASAIRALIPGDADEYEKVCTVHDVLAQEVKYDYESLSSDQFGVPHTAYAALVLKKAVCAGYSRAFLYLMNQLGIEAGLCSGRAGGDSHEWNYVRIDGNYYWVDVTWDNADEESGRIRHDYLLVTDEMLARTHVFNKKTQYFVPHCTSMERNYYRMNGSFFEYYDKEQIAAFLKAHKKDGYAEMMFADANALNEAENDLFEKRNIWSMADIGGGTFYHAVREEMYTMSVLFPED